MRALNETNKEANVQARRMFERAIELDPQYAAVYARLGGTYFLDSFYQWNPSPQTLERAGELAQQAIALDNSLPWPHLLLANVYLWKNRQYEQAIAEAERALVSIQTSLRAITPWDRCRCMRDGRRRRLH